MKRIVMIIIGSIFSLSIGLMGCSNDESPELIGIAIEEEALITLSVGQSIQINASPVPAEAYYGTFGFWSKTPAIATVSDDGLITAVGIGNTTVYVHDSDKKVQRPIAIVVQQK